MIITDKNRLAQYHGTGEWGNTRLHDLFDETVNRFPERLALVDPYDKLNLSGCAPQRLTYKELAANVNQLTDVLLTNGLGKDDIVLVQMPNVVELIYTYLAASRLGIIVSPVPVQYQENELSSILDILQPAAVILTPQFKQTSLLDKMKNSIRLSSLTTQLPKILIWGEGEADCDLLAAIEQPSSSTRYVDYCKQQVICADDLMTICWTSGTEGVPKGVPRSHNQWLAIGKATYLGNHIADNETLLNPFPLINMASIGGMFFELVIQWGEISITSPIKFSGFFTTNCCRKGELHFSATCVVKRPTEK